jgi:hypothetical protein
MGFSFLLVNLVGHGTRRERCLLLLKQFWRAERIVAGGVSMAWVDAF